MRSLSEAMVRIDPKIPGRKRGVVVAARDGTCAKSRDFATACLSEFFRFRDFACVRSDRAAAVGSKVRGRALESVEILYAYAALAHKLMPAAGRAHGQNLVCAVPMHECERWWA